MHKEAEHPLWTQPWFDSLATHSHDGVLYRILKLDVDDSFVNKVVEAKEAYIMLGQLAEKLGLVSMKREGTCDQLPNIHHDRFTSANIVVQTTDGNFLGRVQHMSPHGVPTEQITYDICWLVFGEARMQGE